MDRALSANVLAKSGKAVELAGDIDTLLLDKTGTITIGDRQATEFHPLLKADLKRMAFVCINASLGDQTPEGRSLVVLGEKILGAPAPNLSGEVEAIPFSAQTRISGLNTADGKKFRKGAPDAICRFAVEQGGVVPQALPELVNQVARKGSTPIVVALDQEILGVAALSDVLKPGIHDRFARLRAMGCAWLW